MLNEPSSFASHERFKELCALANSGTLSSGEWDELKRHLEICADCRDIHGQYQLLSSIGMPYLAAIYGYPNESERDHQLEEHLENWDDSAARERLLADIAHYRSPGRSHQSRTEVFPQASPGLLGLAANSSPASSWIKGGLAAAVGLICVLGAYHLGSRTRITDNPTSSASFAPTQSLIAAKNSNEQLLALQTARIAQIEEQTSRGEKEIVRLRAALALSEQQSKQLATTATATQAELRSTLDQRDKLVQQLQQAQQSFESVKAELTSLRAEHDRTLLHTASLESRVSDLTDANRDQERRLGDDQQYLASDRDIRELMGARKLYIADVFDVDSGSRTRKPFGRVFYTENKSLIFYAFDLDHQAGVKNASIFQVWGQKDADLGEKARPMNLGILYMDSESNRRWVLRVDDAKQIDEIDAVFVTVEPHGGSVKPTGKPFLYALLRKEANHP